VLFYTKHFVNYTSAALSKTFSIWSIFKPGSLNVLFSNVAEELKASVI